MLQIHLMNPWIVPAAIPFLAFMGFMLYRGFKLRSEARRAYGDEELLSKFSTGLILSSEIVVMAAWIVVAMLLAIVIAMPVAPNSPSKIPNGSTQVVAVIDVSPSMAAEDHRSQFPAVNGTPPLEVLGPYGRRIDEVRMAIEQQIMPALVGNELGVVLYQSEAKNQMDLDDNFQKLRWEFGAHWTEIGQAPGDGSDYGKGLAMALDVFANTPAPNKQKVIILFSDGGSDGIDRKALAETIEKIKAQGIKVVVVAVGDDKPIKVNRYNAQGLADGYVQLEACEEKDPEGNCQTKLNLKELQDLAANFDTTPLSLTVGAKLPIQWATSIAGSKAENQPVHRYRYFLVPCLLLVLLIQLRDVISRRQSVER